MGWQMVDDLTGVPIGTDDEDGGTVTISVDGEACEIDLCGAGKQQLRDVLKPYYDAGRPVTKPAKAAPKAAPKRADPAPPKQPPAPAEPWPAAEGEPNRTELRRWATEQGIPVSEKGNISADVRDRYMKAHRGAGSATPQTAKLAEAEHMLTVGNATMNTIAAATGLTVQQVRDLNAAMERGAAVGA